MKRPLFIIGASYFLATVTAIVLGASAAWAAGALCLFWASGAFFLFHRKKAFKIMIPLLSGSAAFVLFFAYTQLYLQPLSLPKGSQLPMSGVVLSVSEGDWGSQIQLQANINPVYPEEVPIKLYVFNRDFTPKAGQKVTGVVKVAESYSNTGSVHLLSKGEMLSCVPDSPLRIEENTAGLTLYQKMMVVRQYLLDACDQLYRGENRQTIKAVLLGDSKGMSPSLQRQMNLSGLRHLTAVSGFHISLLSGLFLTLTKRLGFSPRLSGGILLPLLVVTAMLQGMTPSVVRACVMAGVLCISQMVYRQYDSLNSLGLAVLVILVPNPMAAAGASFLLSFGAMLGILLFHQPIYAAIMALPQIGRHFQFGSRLLPGAVQMFAASVSAQLLTIPLQIYYFGRLSVFGIFATMLASLFLPGMMVLGFLSLILWGLPWMVPAMWAAMGTNIFLNLFRLVAALFALLPGIVFSPSQLYLWGLLPIFYLGGWMLWKKKKEWRLPALLMAFILLFMGEALWRWSEQKSLHILGREDFVLLIQDGNALAAGSFPDEYTAFQVSELLERNQVTSLETVIVTDPDAQDCYGAYLLSEWYQPEQIAAPPEGRYLPFLEKSAGEHLKFLEEPVLLKLGEKVQAVCIPSSEGTELQIHAGNKNILKSADGCVIIEKISPQEILILPDGSFVYLPEKGIIALPGREHHLMLKIGGVS